MNLCHTCGAPHAGFGIGPPLRRETVWFCRECFTRQPEGQAMFQRMIGDAADD